MLRNKVPPNCSDFKQNLGMAKLHPLLPSSFTCGPGSVVSCKAWMGCVCFQAYSVAVGSIHFLVGCWTEDLSTLLCGSLHHNSSLHQSVQARSTLARLKSQASAASPQERHPSPVLYSVVSSKSLDWSYIQGEGITQGCECHFLSCFFLCNVCPEMLLFLMVCALSSVFVLLVNTFSPWLIPWRAWAAQVLKLVCLCSDPCLAT